MPFKHTGNHPSVANATTRSQTIIDPHLTTFPLGKMRVKRIKQYKKLMSVYQNVFGFREPFQILIDGTVILAGHRFKMNLDELLPRLISSKAKILYTTCIMKELESIEAEGIKTAVHFARKRFQWRKCDHKDDPVSAKECVQSMVGEKNQHKFIVATQDAELRSILRRTPAVPLIYIKNSVCIMEPLSGSTGEAVNKIEIAKTKPEVFENIPKEGQEVEVKKKRKIKEPNPLSRMKKQKTDNDDELQENATEGERKRKRGKRGKKKAAEADVTQVEGE
jgi:U3 small nucleolar RNA-associated protein 23